jgi:hypothetical protein
MCHLNVPIPNVIMSLDPAERLYAVNVFAMDAILAAVHDGGHENCLSAMDTGRRLSFHELNFNFINTVGQSLSCESSSDIDGL